MTPQLFDFKGQQVRTLAIDNEPYFVGKDVADILGYKDLNRALNQHVEKENRKSLSLKASGDSYPYLWESKNDFSNKTVINEAGVYDLIFDSQLPQAHEFKRWVTHEVLPAIRKHGAYMTPETIEKALLNPDTIINLATQLKDEQEKRKELQAENNVMKPKALFADAVTTSKDSIPVGDMAKVLKQNGIDIGRNRLFQWFRDNKYVCKRGRDNAPTQRSMELNLMEVRQSLYGTPGEMHPRFTTRITGKGQQYFINKFLTKAEATNGKD